MPPSPSCATSLLADLKARSVKRSMAGKHSWWLATDESGSKHLFKTKPEENVNLFGNHYWYAPTMILVNNISQFLPKQKYGEEPRQVDIKIQWKP